MKKLESKGIEIDYQDLRKKLTSGKRYDSQLITTLNEILHLEGEINNNNAVAVYHYIKTGILVPVNLQKQKKIKGKYSIMMH